MTPRGLCLVLLAGVLVPPTARAHEGATSSDVEIEVDGSIVRLRILFTFQDLDGALFPDRNADGRLEPAEFEAFRRPLVDFCRRVYRLEAAGRPLEFATAEVETEAVFPTPLGALHSHPIVVTLRHELETEPQALRLTIRFPRTGHEEHRARLRVRWGGREEEATLLGDEYLDVRPPADPEPPAGARAPEHPLEGFRRGAASLSLWGLVAALGLLARRPRDVVLVAGPAAAGFVAGWILATRELFALDPASAGALAAVAVAGAGLEGLLAGSATRRWIAVATAAGALEGLAIGRSVAPAPLAASVLAGLLLVSTAAAGAAAGAARTRWPEPAARVLGRAAPAVLVVGAIVLAIARATGRT